MAPSTKPIEPRRSDDPVALPHQFGKVPSDQQFGEVQSERQTATVADAVGVSSEELERRIREATPEIQPWIEEDYTTVKTLQMAQRNHGRVDLLRKAKSKRNQGGRAASLLNDGDYVAVKRMPNKWITDSAASFARQYPNSSELPWLDIGIVSYLSSQGCDFVCRCHGIFQNATDTCVMTTFCNVGDLFGWCERDPRPGLKREAVMRPVVTQLFSAVKHLHNFGIAHRDLSLENVLLHESTECNAQPQLKLIDFGMATTKRFVRNQVRGKFSYQAPEMHKDTMYDAFLSDVFALGVTIFSMAAHDYPWVSTKRNGCKLFEYCKEHGMKKYLQNRKLRNGNGVYLVDVFSPHLAHLLGILLNFDPEKRACLGEAVYSAAESHQTAPLSPWFGENP
jgi:serine/threonine protein kinase